MNGTHQGLMVPVKPDIPVQIQRKPTGINRNKLDLTGWNTTSPKYGPNTHLPLGESVNHGYQTEHQRAPLSPRTT